MINESYKLCAGAPIYTVETVTMLFTETRPEGSDTKQADYTLRGMTGVHWLTGIRLVL